MRWQMSWYTIAAMTEATGRFPTCATRLPALAHWTGPRRPVMVSHVVLFTVGSEGLA